MHTISALAGVERVHLLGIGGSGMSGLARLIHATDVTVSGSDRTPSSITEDLIDDGIPVTYMQDGSALDASVGLIVHSAAIDERNAELAISKALGIPTVKYARMLGLVMRDRLGIAVAGTHGKTSTSSMATWLLESAQLKPSWVIGGVPHDLGSGAGAGEGVHFVVEACEYDRSFLQLSPYIAAITNIDADHLDYYRDLAEIKEAFRTFVARIPPDGHLVVNADDPNSLDVAHAAVCNVTTFGLQDPDADIRVRRSGEDLGCPRFVWSLYGGDMDEIQLRVPGEHNLYNAGCALGIGQILGIPWNSMRRALSSFTGVRRRFHLRGSYHGVPILDDYGHHPNEIRPTLEALRDVYPDRRSVVIFQPHQASRTRLFLDEFAEVLTNADRVIVTHIFAAREDGIDNDALCDSLVARIRAAGTDAVYKPHFEDILDELRYGLDPDNVVLTLGAGNINDIATDITTAVPV